MKPTYQQLAIKLEESELARSEQRTELTDSYDYCEMIQEMLHESNMRNARLVVLIASLDKQIKRGLQ